MDEPWKTLAEAGVPIGAVRARPTRFDRREIRRALARLAGAIETPFPPGYREPLWAWLRGLADEWPSAFARLEPEASTLLTRLSAEPADENRYLKHRRIAVENLAGAL